MVCAVIAAGAVGLYARKKPHTTWLDTPFTSWKRNQVIKLFNDSPWARSRGYRGQTTGEHGNFNPGVTGTSGNATLGVNTVDYSFTARLFSAEPVREAYVRMLQIMNHYNSLAPAQKQIFDSKVDWLLHADVSKEVVVALFYHTNDPLSERSINQWFATQTAGTLRQNAYLYTSSAGQVQLIKYFPAHGSGGLGARFIYPRMINGKPILQAGDQRMRFQLYVPQVGQTIYLDFQPSQMMYKGQLSY
jgi:hypothetical protein